MKELFEISAYAAVVVLGCIALGFFAVLPALSLVTSLVYQGF